MTEIIIAIIGSLTTILTAVITGLFSSREIKQREALIPQDLVTAQNMQSFKAARKSMFWKILSVVTFFVGVIIAISVVSLKSKWATQSAIEKIDSGYKKLISKGLEKTDGNPYIIPALVMEVNLEKVRDTTGSHLEADISIIYNTVYIKNIPKGSRAFDDYWRANRGGEVINLNGSDKEVMTAESRTSKAWNFIFPASAGDNRMTISHFREIYPSKLQTYDSRFFGRLNTNEEEFAYPNNSDDVIGELVIMVSSSTLNLQLADIHNAAIGSLNDLNPRDWIDPSKFTTNDRGKTCTTVVARFTNMGDKDVAKLKLSW